MTGIPAPSRIRSVLDLGHQKVHVAGGPAGGGGSSAVSAAVSTRGRPSLRTRPSRSTPPRPSASRLRTQSASRPYGSPTMSRSPLRNAVTGVRYSRPDLRPRWTIIAKGGR